MENSELGFHGGDEFGELLRSLTKETNLISGWTFFRYQGFWYPEFVLKNVVSFQKHFVALDGDLLLASCPKAGTTWLKALSFSIVNRSRYTLSDTPLLTANPHALVPFLEFMEESESVASLDDIQNPRLLCTHVPYSSLPPSIRNSGCKIVYICRNAMDQFVSNWHFFSNFLDKKPASVSEESFDQFCRGVHSSGPFWDHVLEFWNASLERPGKILFLRYEDLQKDTAVHVKRLAEFLGFPFSKDENKQGVVDEIIKFCSIANMKTLEGNVRGQRPASGAPNSSFFRKGEVGDWVNHLTPSMAERLKRLVQEKYELSSLQMF